MLVFFLHGRMMWRIFPNDLDISFETHFFAAAPGLLLAIMCKNRDPYAPEKLYNWEDEEEDHESSLNAGGGDGGDTRGHFYITAAQAYPVTLSYRRHLLR